MIPEVEVDLQVAIAEKNGLYLPNNQELAEWAAITLAKVNYEEPTVSVSIRVVSEDEITELNKNYRNIDKPTNVLSFPYEALPDVEIDLLGDIVVCAAVMQIEAQQQSKNIEQHWAHIIIHGVLHLLGFDHAEDTTAEEMESLEVSILSSLGIPNPYGEVNTP